MTKRHQVDFSDETWACLDHLQPGYGKAQLIEDLLWQSRRLQRVAKQLGIGKPKRRRPGRPKTFNP